MVPGGRRPCPPFRRRPPELSGVRTRYFSPFPKDVFDFTEKNEPKSIRMLYFDEFGLKAFLRREQLERYLKHECQLFHPPGDEIYREERAEGQPTISIFEVDPTHQRIYCENLCLLAKLFLDHKTLYYDVEPFLFYVVCTVDAEGAHMVGYFSKEKHSSEEYNLACILTLPCYQRKGSAPSRGTPSALLPRPVARTLFHRRSRYGKLMIAFSYELSRREENRSRPGTPERPISDLGLVSYRSYWVYALLEILQKHRGAVSIAELSEQTGFRTDDIVKTLQAFNMIRYFGGQHSIYVGPHTLAKYHTNAKPNWRILQQNLKWVPYDKRVREKPRV